MKTSFEVLVTPGDKSGMEGAVPNTTRAISRFDMLFWPRSPMISANIAAGQCEAHLQDAHPRHQLGHGSRWRCEPQFLDFTNFPIHKRREDSDVECLMPRCHQDWADVHEGARTRALKLTHRFVPPVGIQMQNHAISLHLLS
jgi:hypothetical protein